MLADRIEAEAKAWNAAGRDESLRWSEDYIAQQMREIVESAEVINDIVRPGVSRAFSGRPIRARSSTCSA